MKATAMILILTILCSISYGQSDKSKRASPPDTVKVITNDAVQIQIDYSRPFLKGRQIGVDIAPIGQVWRTGANEATTITFDQNVKVEGQHLSKGKYSLYSLPGENQTTIIFNKIWDQWGTKYDQNEDALRVLVNNKKSDSSAEQFKITIDKSGIVSLIWGDYLIPFKVEIAP